MTYCKKNEEDKSEEVQWCTEMQNYGVVSVLKEEAETTQTGSLRSKMKDLPGSFCQVTELLGGSPAE